MVRLARVVVLVLAVAAASALAVAQSVRGVIVDQTGLPLPGDVYAVVGSPRAGQFANSVGPIVRGYMLLKW